MKNKPCFMVASVIHPHDSRVNSNFNQGRMECVATRLFNRSDTLGDAVPCVMLPLHVIRVCAGGKAGKRQSHD